MTNVSATRSQIRRQIADSGKVTGIPSSGFEIKCSCWESEPGKGGARDPGRRFRVRGPAGAVLDEWAVHLADCHPSVEAPCLARVETGARGRIVARRERAQAEKDGEEAAFWEQIFAQLPPDVRARL